MFRKKMMTFSLLILIIALSACSLKHADTKADSIAATDKTENATAASQIEDTGKKQSDEYTSWDDVPVNEYREETITVDYNGQTIWGVAFIPELNREKYPLVICSHGLGGSYTSCMEYAELLASHSLATYSFDFRGGGGTRSDGKTTEMSLISVRQGDGSEDKGTVLLSYHHIPCGVSFQQSANPSLSVSHDKTKKPSPCLTENHFFARESNKALPRRFCTFVFFIQNKYVEVNRHPEKTRRSNSCPGG